MTAKKSFFERLTGATKEEIFGEPEDNIEPLEKVELEKITLSEPKISKFPVEKIGKLIKQAKPKEVVAEESDEEGQLTIDVYQTENDIIIKSTIAGVQSEDIDVSITNDMLTIKGIRRKNTSIPQGSYYYQELYWGPFSRSIILPIDVDADKIKADLKEGILTVKLPKAAKLKTKTIKVKAIEQ